MCNSMFGYWKSFQSTQVSVEIEDPFGLEMHDLELCDDIKTSRADIKMFLEHVHDDQYQQAVLEETALF